MNIYIDKISAKLDEVISNPSKTYSEETLRERIKNGQPLVVNDYLTFVGVSFDEAFYHDKKEKIINSVKRAIADFKRLNEIHHSDSSMSEESAKEVNKVLERLVNEFSAYKN